MKSRSCARGQADGDALALHIFLGLGDGEFAVVEDAGGQGGMGPALHDGLTHVDDVARAAAGDDGNGDGVCDGACEFEIVAGLCAVGVDAVEDDLARAELGGVLGPLEGVDATRAAAVRAGVGADFPTG